MNSEKNCILLIHGYMTEKNDLAHIESLLQTQDYTVHNVDIAGHENITEEEDFINSSWDDWFGSIEEVFLQYRKKNYAVSLVGHSMGGLISLKLAEKYPTEVQALAVLAAPIYINRFYPLEITNYLTPLIPLIKNFTDKIDKNHFRIKKSEYTSYYYPKHLDYFIKAMKDTRKNLGKIIAPILVLQAFGDKTVPFSCPTEIARNVQSKHRILKYYTIVDEKSKKHQITSHHETKKEVAKDILNFFQDFLN